MRSVGVARRVADAWARREHKVATVAVVLATVVAVVAATVVIGNLLAGKPSVQPECRVAVGSSRYVVDPEQAANATTITAVGKRLGLPDHAVTIALATSLQESQLHNLSYGDRDSVGLFQQRPSQGWGTKAQIMDPRYSAAAFFRALERVPGWQTASVTTAAQAVQHSAAPTAYAPWEGLARTLAIATTGESPAALSCQFSPDRSRRSPASLVSAMTNDLGPAPLDTPVSPRRGWMIASWLVSHADEFRITSVRFAAKQWTPAGEWRPMPAWDAGVRVTQSFPTS